MSTSAVSGTKTSASLNKRISAGIVIGVGLLLWFLPPPAGLKPAGMHLTALLIDTILGLILQPLPQGAVMILGVAMTAMTQTLPISAAMAGFSDATAWLRFSSPGVSSKPDWAAESPMCW